MAEKIWAYVYVDEMTRTKDEEENILISCEHRNLFGNCPMTYDVPEEKCYIHSPRKIAGLQLFRENSPMIPNVWE